MQDYTDFCCPYIPPEDIYYEVEAVWQKYWTEDSLPVQVELIAERMGLDIIPTADLREIDAYLKIDMTGIVVNLERYLNDKYTRRLRFSIAHEIGHLVLHERFIKRMKFNNDDKYYEFITQFPSDDYSRFEYQANEFAGRLLVPPQKLEERINAEMVKINEYALLKQFIKRDSSQVLSSIAPKLCIPFDVSEKTICIRAEKEGLWPPRTEK